MQAVQAAARVGLGTSIPSSQNESDEPSKWHCCNFLMAVKHAAPCLGIVSDLWTLRVTGQSAQGTVVVMGHVIE